MRESSMKVLSVSSLLLVVFQVFLFVLVGFVLSYRRVSVEIIRLADDFMVVFLFYSMGPSLPVMMVLDYSCGKNRAKCLGKIVLHWIATALIGQAKVIILSPRHSCFSPISVRIL